MVCPGGDVGDPTGLENVDVAGWRCGLKLLKGNQGNQTVAGMKWIS